MLGKKNFFQTNILGWGWKSASWHSYSVGDYLLKKEYDSGHHQTRAKWYNSFWVEQIMINVTGGLR